MPGTSELRPCHLLLQNPPWGCSSLVSLWGTCTLHPTQVSPSFPAHWLLSDFLLSCSALPTFPLSDLAAIMEPSNVNLPLIYHISSSDIQIRFPLSVRIIVILLYGLNSSFLVLCLWAVVYYYFPIWKLISLKPESLPLPCSVQHEAGALSGLDKPFVIQAAF